METKLNPEYIMQSVSSDNLRLAWPNPDQGPQLSRHGTTYTRPQLHRCREGLATNSVLHRNVRLSVHVLGVLSAISCSLFQAQASGCNTRPRNTKPHAVPE